MAISPLALGIGLQGKYDYRQQAALEMSRQKGRAKAEADEEAARAKKLAPIERRLINMRGAPLLPVHQKEVTRKVAEALDYMMEHPEDLSGVTQRAYDIESSTQAYKGQYDAYKKSQFGKNVKGNAEAIRVLGIADNPDDIADALGGIAGSTIKFDPQSKNVTFEPIDYLPTATHIDKAFTAGGTQYLDLTGKETIINVGKRKFTTFGLNPAVPEMIKQDVLNARDKVIALTNDYSQYLESNNQPLPNLRTAEGKQEFNDGMIAFLDESIARDFANRGLLKDVTPATRSSLTINTGQNAAASTYVDVYEPKLILHGKKRKIQTYPGTPVLSDIKMTLANNDQIWDVETMRKVSVAKTITVTYGEPALVAVATENYNIPAQTFTKSDGTVVKLDALQVSKGEPLTEGYDDLMAQKGKAKANYVIYGVYKDPESYENKSIVRNLSDIGIGQAYAASKSQAQNLTYIEKQAPINLANANAEIKAKYKPAKPAESGKTKPATTGNAGTGDYSLFRSYKNAGGKLSMPDWKKANKPTK